MASGQWTRTGPAIPRIRGRALQHLRAKLFARQPWCVLCLKAGRWTRPSIRDHTIPLAEGGRDDATNEQAICAECNRDKTREESARGAGRR